jgi:hypothetical protein
VRWAGGVAGKILQVYSGVNSKLDAEEWCGVLKNVAKRRVATFQVT